MTSPSTTTTISTAIQISTAAIVSMVEIVRRSFPRVAELEALAELAGREALAVLVELEALEVLEEPVATGGSTTLHIAAGLRTEIALLQTALAGRLVETR
jgi:hypothetical protein